MAEIKVNVTIEDQPTSAIRILYERYAGRYADSWKNAPAEYAEAIRSIVEGETAMQFAQHVLDHPEELAEAQKEAQERDRAWKEHQAKQALQAGQPDAKA